MVLMYMLMQTLILNVVGLHPRERSLAFGDRVMNVNMRDKSSKSSIEPKPSAKSKSSKSSTSISDKSSKKSKSISEKSSKSSKKSKSTAFKSSKSFKKSKFLNRERWQNHKGSKSFKGFKSSKSFKSFKSSKSFKSESSTTTSLSEMAHYAKMDHQPERVEEKDPLVKASAETEPPKLFWYELGAAICGVSFLVHVYILRKKLGSTTTTRDSGGAYKPIAMNGGEAELTKFGSKNDLDAEYGDGDESDDDEDLGSPESFGMRAQ